MSCVCEWLLFLVRVRASVSCVCFVRLVSVVVSGFRVYAIVSERISCFLRL